MNEDLARQLPKTPEPLGWEIGTSGDGTAGTVTIRLIDQFNPKKHLVTSEYELPKGTQPHGIVGLVCQEAKNLLLAYERFQVLQTLPGTYDSAWTPVNIEEGEEKA